jgi:arsenate reductase
VHDSVVTAMRELDVDLSDRKPRLLTTDITRWADVVITMGCGDECPVIPGKRYIDWDLPDPKDLNVKQVRAIRDDISGRVNDLVESLDRKPI